MRQVEWRALLFHPRSGIVLIRLKLILRAPVIRHHLAVGVVRLKIQALAETPPHFHNRCVVSRERAVLQQIASQKERIWEQLDWVVGPRKTAAVSIKPDGMIQTREATKLPLIDQGLNCGIVDKSPAKQIREDSQPLTAINGRVVVRQGPPGRVCPEREEA